MKKKLLKNNISFIIGLTLLFLGASLLLWTVAKIPYALTLIPLLFVCFGVFCLYLYSQSGNDMYLFVGMFCLLGALFIFIKQQFPDGYIKSYWPLYPLLIGVAIFIFSLKKNRRRRIAFLVPAAAFIFLSLLFLPFSLGLVHMSFLQFMRIWWPAGFLILGIVLLIIHFRRQKKEKQSK